MEETSNYKLSRLSVGDHNMERVEECEVEKHQ